MRIIYEFKNVKEYLEFKKKTTQDNEDQEQRKFIPEDSINGKYLKDNLTSKCSC